MNDEKFILDACCGPKQMWVDKKHPNVVYIDNRQEKKGFNPHRKNETILPDIIMDNRNMSFPDESFKLVVFDPPHCNSGIDSGFQMSLKYGSLDKNTWRRDIKNGFDECWRVLAEYGVLIFKWSNINYSYKEVIKSIGRQPLFRNMFIRGKNKTYWACFMKIPNQPQQTLTKED